MLAILEKISPSELASNGYISNHNKVRRPRPKFKVSFLHISAVSESMILKINFEHIQKNTARLEWRGCGSGMGMGTGTPFRDKPPRLSRKGGLRVGSSINAPLRDNRGGLSRKGVLSRLMFQLFFNAILCSFCVKRRKPKLESIHLADSSFFAFLLA